MAFDYGRKRTGIAVTDPSQIIATGLTHYPHIRFFVFLASYLQIEPVEAFVVGSPGKWTIRLRKHSNSRNLIVKKLRKLYPHIPVYRVDERMTSRMATTYATGSGAKKSDRQRKGLVDKISAC
jgi:putative Holliday junction resolvase